MQRRPVTVFYRTSRTYNVWHTVLAIPQDNPDLAERMIRRAFHAARLRSQEIRSIVIDRVSL